MLDRKIFFYQVAFDHPYSHNNRLERYDRSPKQGFLRGLPQPFFVTSRSLDRVE